MQFEHEFVLPVPIDRAWAILTDIERIAPSMPGAQLLEIAGNDYKGTVKIKVGPITAQYNGVARMIEQDEAARKMVLEGKGSDSYGQGSATAIATGRLHDEGAQTRVTLTTDLQISGKVAQLGQGVMKDVSARLLKQFVANLEGRLDEQTDRLGSAKVGDVRKVESAEAEAIDILKIGGSAVMKRYGVAIAAVAAVVAIGLWNSKRN